MGPLHGSLAILALVASAPMAAPAVITSDAAFYGQSPPVYPSRMSSPCLSAISL